MKNQEQQRGMFSVIFLYASLIGLGIGHDVGHAQTKQGALLNSSNKTPLARVEVLDVPRNADNNLPKITKNQQNYGCHKTQSAAQLVRLKNHVQTGNHTPKSYADNIKIIDLGLESVINAQWSGLIRAVKDGDVNQALRFISTNQSGAARNDWAMLHKYLSNLTENISEPLHVTAINGNQIVAQAVIPSTRASLQCPLEINFILDTDEYWRLNYY